MFKDPQRSLDGTLKAEQMLWPSQGDNKADDETKCSVFGSRLKHSDTARSVPR